MKLTSQLLDDLTARAKSSPRLRMNLDLRTSPEDGSQRMLNALEPGTEIPIHRHRKSTETVVLIRGAVRQNYYDDSGNLTESFIAAAPSSMRFASDLSAGQSAGPFAELSSALSAGQLAGDSRPAGPAVADLAADRDSQADCVGFNVPTGQWHNTVCLEPGTVFIESKDGAYEPLGDGDLMG